jgi:hypothetical protein
LEGEEVKMEEYPTAAASGKKNASGVEVDDILSDID